MDGTQSTLARALKLRERITELKKKSLKAALNQSAGIGPERKKRLPILRGKG